MCNVLSLSKIKEMFEKERSRVSDPTNLSKYANNGRYAYLLLATEKLMNMTNNYMEVDRKKYKVTFVKDCGVITIILQDKNKSNIYKKLVIKPFKESYIGWFFEHPNWVYKKGDLFVPYTYEYTNSYLWEGKPEIEEFYPNTFFLSTDDDNKSLEGTCLDPSFNDKLHSIIREIENDELFSELTEVDYYDKAIKRSLSIR